MLLLYCYENPTSAARAKDIPSSAAGCRSGTSAPAQLVAGLLAMSTLAHGMAACSSCQRCPSALQTETGHGKAGDPSINVRGEATWTTARQAFATSSGQGFARAGTTNNALFAVWRCTE